MLGKKHYDITNSAPFQNITLGTGQHTSPAWSLCPCKQQSLLYNHKELSFPRSPQLWLLSQKSRLCCYVTCCLLSEEGQHASTARTRTHLPFPLQELHKLLLHCSP